MERRYKFITLIATLLLTVVAFIFWQISNDVMFINETFALLLLIGSTVAKWSRSNKIQLVIFLALFVPLFSLLNYTYTVEDGDTITTYHSARFSSLVDPIVFLILVVFLGMNLSVIIKFFKGSDEDITDKSDKLTTFYYDKFNSSDERELIGLYKMYNDYPLEAQIALRKIHEERNLNILNFN
ncbi:hypothetical protein [Mucilaginibacter myungsuensis]|uniref:Uncharacterized protein n=1 Tax=Mucilaginibacter myungsuensis TaxID=649104 RepID=A0A929KWL6_9SPHI|nr:hypothetical protein [Mucilaginibacter myungsuensis]MBE9661268.1 hypothetical protein [Mucilaginibacter myungsuensis]MDN3597411.1 hypothetical protein [Mucilaginibacter myungsuensis]